MPTQINCPSCSRALRVPDELLGKNVKCPTCSTTFEASAEGPPPAPPEEEELPVAPPARRPAPPDDYDEPQEEERRPRRRRREHLEPHRGGMIMVLGILAICGIAVIPLGPIAWILGNSDLKAIRAGRMDPEGESQTNTGRICGMIATILWGGGLVLCCTVYIVIFAIFGVAGAGAQHGMH